MTTPVMIDLDAARRESAFPDGIPVVKGGVTFTLPAELPLGIFEPLLGEELDLVGTVTGVITAREEKRRIARMNDEQIDEEEGLGQAVVDALIGRPTLPKATIDAILETFALLFGPAWPGFLEQNPSVTDLLRLGRGLLPLYAVSLGEAFASLDSSESDGATPKPTSEPTTASTSEVSGGTRKKKAS